MATISEIPGCPLSVTMGDPAGIGPDIIVTSWNGRQKHGLPTFVALGCPDVFEQRAHQLGLTVPIELVEGPEEASAHFDHALPVFPLPVPERVVPGSPDASSATATITAIDTAVRWVLRGEAAALVTAPINKKHLVDAGFTHPGHTEYLAELCATDDSIPRPVMMLAGGGLRVVPVTIHIPLKDVPESLTQEAVIETTQITDTALRTLFHVQEPRIAVTGLNPHAGESGMLGTEEIDIIIPAIEHLKARGFNVSGPFPADAVYQERSRSRYDAIIAMYHDQALIPVKTLAFDETVNVTLGLPLIRTSPDHGTAYELAGTGKAHPGSLIASIKLAQQMARAVELVAS